MESIEVEQRQIVFWMNHVNVDVGERLQMCQIKRTDVNVERQVDESWDSCRLSKYKYIYIFDLVPRTDSLIAYNHSVYV